MPLQHGAFQAHHLKNHLPQSVTYPDTWAALSTIQGVQMNPLSWTPVNASCLDRMIWLCVEHCVYFVPIHFFLLFSLSKISVLLYVSTLKKIAQGLGGKRRETTLRVGDERKSSEMRVWTLKFQMDLWEKRIGWSNLGLSSCGLG